MALINRIIMYPFFSILCVKSDITIGNSVCILKIKTLEINSQDRQLTSALNIAAFSRWTRNKLLAV